MFQEELVGQARQYIETGLISRAAKCEEKFYLGS
jgi:hypothetical protein